MRKKNEIARFARWCFDKCGVPPCKITYASAKTLITHGNVVFGCYRWDADAREPGEIYVAYRIPKWGVMSVVAHEIWHHRQQMTVGIDNIDAGACEAEAEKACDELMGLWLIRGGRIRND